MLTLARPQVSHVPSVTPRGAANFTRTARARTRIRRPVDHAAGSDTHVRRAHAALSDAGSPALALAAPTTLSQTIGVCSISGSGELSANGNYTYDNKNNPFKNISGNGFFINIWFQGLNLYPSINNNIVTAENENNIFFYTYDEDDYPISFNSPNGFNYKSNIQVNITYTN